MTTFLMLFAEYRARVISEAQAQAALAAANERLVALEAENQRLHAEVLQISSARAEELRKVADTFSQQAIHRNVFARAEAPVVTGPIEQPKPRRVFARDLMNAATRQTIQSMYAEAVKERQQPPDFAA
jgi:multidrug resistance efflux pump